MNFFLSFQRSNFNLEKISMDERFLSFLYKELDPRTHDLYFELCSSQMCSQNFERAWKNSAASELLILLNLFLNSTFLYFTNVIQPTHIALHSLE